MRDIKFRAWDNKRKRWAEWVEVYSDGTFNIGYLDDDGLHHWLDDVGSINFDSDKECILMQFTGLCDKNGTEIYEGDIVTDIYINGEYYTGNHEVVFIGSSFCIRIKRGINIRHDYEPCLDETWLEMIEVIGNKYENPELIKECIV